MSFVRTKYNFLHFLQHLNKVHLQQNPIRLIYNIIIRFLLVSKIHYYVKIGVIFLLSGISQSSNRGPLLFSIYVNDICRNLTANFLLYTDTLELSLNMSDTEQWLQKQDELFMIKITLNMFNYSQGAAERF